MVRRYLPLVGIVTVLLLSVGSLLAGPLLGHRPRHDSQTAQPPHQHRRAHTWYKRARTPLADPASTAPTPTGGAIGAAASDMGTAVSADPSAPSGEADEGRHGGLWILDRIADFKKWWDLNAAAAAQSWHHGTGGAQSSTASGSGQTSGAGDSPGGAGGGAASSSSSASTGQGLAGFLFGGSGGGTTGGKPNTSTAANGGSGATGTTTTTGSSGLSNAGSSSGGATATAGSVSSGNGSGGTGGAGAAGGGTASTPPTAAGGTAGNAGTSSGSDATSGGNGSAAGGSTAPADPSGDGSSGSAVVAGATSGASSADDPATGSSDTIASAPAGGPAGSGSPGSRTNRVTLLDMDNGKNASYTWSDSFILSHATQGLTVHWTDAFGTNLMGRAASLVQQGMPAATLYSFPMMSSDFTPWGASLTEDMFLHNGGNDQAHRVRHTSGELQTVMDPGNPGYANAIASLLAGLVKDNGLSGLFLDGELNNLTLKYIYDWIVPPTQDDINGWMSRLPAFYSALKRALGSKLLISNTSDPGAHMDLVSADDAIIDIVDGTMMEGWLSQNFGTLSDQGYAIYKTALSRARLKNKILWVLNTDGDTHELLNLYGIYLLDASPNLWFEAQIYDQSTLDTLAKDPGQPLGDAVQQGDGTWVRDFQNVTVRANPSDSSHGGMGSWRSTLSWKQ